MKIKMRKSSRKPLTILALCSVIFLSIWFISKDKILEMTGVVSEDLSAVAVDKDPMMGESFSNSNIKNFLSLTEIWEGEFDIKTKSGTNDPIPTETTAHVEFKNDYNSREQIVANYTYSGTERVLTEEFGGIRDSRNNCFLENPSVPAKFDSTITKVGKVGQRVTVIDKKGKEAQTECTLLLEKIDKTDNNHHIFSIFTAFGLSGSIAPNAQSSYSEEVKVPIVNSTLLLTSSHIPSNNSLNGTFNVSIGILPREVVVDEKNTKRVSFIKKDPISCDKLTLFSPYIVSDAKGIKNNKGLCVFDIQILNSARHYGSPLYISMGFKSPAPLAFDDEPQIVFASFTEFKKGTIVGALSKIIGSKSTVPKINTINPTTLKVGDTLVINGIGFDGVTSKTVSIFGKDGDPIIYPSFVLASPTQIKMKIPNIPNRAYGLKVRSNTGESNLVNFTVFTETK